MLGKILKISISEVKGQKKSNIPSAQFKKNFGILKDAHASNQSHRQISLLSIESITKMINQGVDVHPGDFAENVTTEGLDLSQCHVGTHLKLGKQIILEVTQLGKECHHGCEIFQQVGECVMPTEGIFATVIEGGLLNEGDSIEIINLN